MDFLDILFTIHQQIVCEYQVIIYNLHICDVLFFFSISYVNYVLVYLWELSADKFMQLLGVKSKTTLYRKYKQVFSIHHDTR